MAKKMTDEEVKGLAEQIVSFVKKQDEQLKEARKLLDSASRGVPEFMYDYEEFLVNYPDKN